MRTFCFALLIFSFIILIIIANAFTVSKITKEMLTLTDSMPSLEEAKADGFRSAKETAFKIYSAWQKHENFIGLSVNYDFIFNIDVTARELIGYVSAEDSAEYSAAIARLRSRIMRLREAESFSIHNIT